MLVSVSVGAKDIPLSDVLGAIFNYDEGQLDHILVRDSRLPRTLCAALVGAVLALSGAMMQGVLKNPVAEPSIMGVNQGATLMVAISMVSSLAGGVLGNFAMALVGAAVTGGLLLLFTMSNSANQSMARILLAGTAMSTFFLALATVVGLLGGRSQELAFWVAGGLRQTGWTQVLVLLLVGGAFSALAFAWAGKVNVLNLGDDFACGLGLRPQRVKMQVIAMIVPLCGVAVAVAGNIGYIGLFVPHILRRIVGSDYRVLMPASFVFGAAVLVWADIAARMVMAPYELPVGLFTAIIGVPVFLLLVRGEKH
jgi:iron complex transport system permease protein